MAADITFLIIYYRLHFLVITFQQFQYGDHFFLLCIPGWNGAETRNKLRYCNKEKHRHCWRETSATVQDQLQKDAEVPWYQVIQLRTLVRILRFLIAADNDYFNRLDKSADLPLEMIDKSWFLGLRLAALAIMYEVEPVSKDIFLSPFRGQRVSNIIHFIYIIIIYKI